MIEDEKLWNEFIKTRAPELREKLILKYLRFVGYILRTNMVRRQSVLEPEDLFQEGVFGLIEAVDKYDPTRGVKFMTFAHWYIRGRIKDALRKASFFPRQLRQDLEKFRELFAQSSAVTNEEVVQVLQVTPKRVETLRLYRETDIRSLNAQVSSDSKDTLEDFLRDPSEGPEELYEIKELWGEIREALEYLPDRSRRIFMLYFREGHTMRETGRIVGISESRVSQIVNKMLRQFRDYLREKGILHGS